MLWIVAPSLSSFCPLCTSLLKLVKEAEKPIYSETQGHPQPVYTKQKSWPDFSLSCTREHWCINFSRQRRDFWLNPWENIFFLHWKEWRMEAPSFGAYKIGPPGANLVYLSQKNKKTPEPWIAHWSILDYRQYVPLTIGDKSWKINIFVHSHYAFQYDF